MRKTMEKRFILTVTLCLVLYLLWFYTGQYLGYEMGRTEEPVVEQVESTQNDTKSPLETTPIEVPTVSEQVEQKVIEPKTVQLENDILSLKFDNRGGVLRKAILKQYYNSAKREELVQLIHPKHYFPGEVIIGTSQRTQNWMFDVTESSRQKVTMVGEQDGIQITKVFELKDNYTILSSVSVSGTDKPIKMVVSEGLQPVLPKDKLVPSFFDFGAINPKIMRIAWSEDGTHEDDDIGDLEIGEFAPVLDKPEKVVWAGIQDTYFANVFIPEQPTDNLFVAGVQHRIPNREPVTLPAVAIDGQGQINGLFYMGPTAEDTLETADERLSNLVSYGWAGYLSKGLFILLRVCYNMTGNWGWAIVILTLFIKFLLFPLAVPSMKSSIKMRKLQPKLEKLKQKYSDDSIEAKQQMQQEMFKIYREEGVNPFSSCLTMLPQMPIFFAYFSLLRTSISLRQAEWIFWIEDLSVKDPTFVLPIVMAGSMFLTSLTMPMTGVDPAQQRMMKFMPLMFAFFFIGMPAGLVLYMITGNIFTLCQSYILRRRYEKRMTLQEHLSAEAQCVIDNLQLFTDSHGLEVSMETSVDLPSIYVNFVGEDEDFFQKNHGESLRDLSFLMHTLVEKKFPESELDIKVDSGGFLLSKEKELQGMAESAAARARDTQNQVLLNPLNPYERRLVHLALQDYEDIETESLGEGHLKRIAVRFKRRSIIGWG